MKHSLVFWAVGGILLTLAAEQFTDWDVLISNAFFNADECSWLISYERHLRLSPLFYGGMKVFVSAVGSIAAVITAASYGYSFLKPYRQGALALVLGTIIIPSAVAFLKDATRIYCPNQLAVLRLISTCLNGIPPGFIPFIRRVVFLPGIRQELLP